MRRTDGQTDGFAITISRCACIGMLTLDKKFPHYCPVIISVYLNYSVYRIEYAASLRRGRDARVQLHVEVHAAAAFPASCTTLNLLLDVRGRRQRRRSDRSLPQRGQTGLRHRRPETRLQRANNALHCRAVRLRRCRHNGHARRSMYVPIIILVGFTIQWRNYKGGQGAVAPGCSRRGGAEQPHHSPKNILCV